MAKTLSPAEITEAIESQRRINAWQAAAQKKEAVLDEMLAYLKSCKRSRPAPTRMYQFPGFAIYRMREMMDRLEAAEAIEREALSDVTAERGRVA